MWKAIQSRPVQMMLSKRKFSAEQYLHLGTIGLIIVSWKFEALKTNIFALEASLFGQIFVLRTSDFR